MGSHVCECGAELEIGFDTNTGYWIECSMCNYKSTSSHDLELIIKETEIRKISVDGVFISL